MIILSSCMLKIHFKDYYILIDNLVYYQNLPWSLERVERLERSSSNICYQENKFSSLFFSESNTQMRSLYLRWELVRVFEAMWRAKWDQHCYYLTDLMRSWWERSGTTCRCTRPFLVIWITLTYQYTCPNNERVKQAESPNSLTISSWLFCLLNTPPDKICSPSASL